MERIRQIFKTLVDLSDADWENFASRLSCRDYSKKSIILPKGKTERHLSFIEKGILRFNIPKPDFDFTFGFAFENSFVSAYDSFLQQSPCMYNVEAITDTVLWRITYTDLNQIYSETLLGDRIGRKVAENLYRRKMKRELSLLQDDATKRYLDLLEEQPELVRQIPLKYLASYIGIRPQSLSRIRKSIS